MANLADVTGDNNDKSQPEGQEELTPKHVLKEFKRAYEAKKKFLEAAKEDFEFALGKQWEDKDVVKLQRAGVRALTINKIAAHLQLVRGIESQNRSDFHAFPEHADDEIKAEVATRLMKNAVKNSSLEFKISEMFEDGNSCGEGHLEPWMNYPYKQKADGTIDMTAELLWKKRYYNQIFPDPTAQEYDYSDARYICKFTTDLTLNELIELFPEQKDYLENLDDEGAKINIDQIELDRDQIGVQIQRKDYRSQDSKTDPWLPTKGYDLLDYYYKKYVPKFFVADFKMNQVRPCVDEAEADRYLAMVKKRDKKAGAPKPTAKKIERLLPELWVAFLTGGKGDSSEFLFHGPAWCFPRWKLPPFFTYSCYKSSAPVTGENRSYLVQGVTRRVKDLNRELNKRRTQELRHLNQSANSGWQGEEDAFMDEDKWESFGSSPGVILKHKKGSQAPTKILPTPLSVGHSQLAQEHQQDMRDAIGINPETLAIEADQSSGRAIALRQKQGMVMVQGQFDNLARTRRQIGRFILSILPELYDVEKAMRVLGQKFIQESFQSPVIDPMTGQPAMDPMTGQPVTQFDPQAAVQTINQVLNDAELGNFDVFVGENISTETIAMANYLQLMDMASKGLPIPPDIIIEESTLSESQKKRIIAAMQQQAQQAAMAAKSSAPSAKSPRPKKGR